MSVGNFRVEISPPRSRGMVLLFESKTQCFGENFHTRVFPIFEQLFPILRILQTDSFINDKVRLLIGMPEVELCFQANAGERNAKFRIDFWPDSKRTTLKSPKVVLSYMGEREEIVEPFLDAIKSLRSSMSDAEFEKEYGEDFPTEEFEKLTSY